MSQVYDTIIIGAGIAGASLAYALTKKNQKVLVLDKNGIASGGSGAAGAFVSPKIGKASPLHALTNEAFEFAKDFYLSHCPAHFHQTGVLRIPKDDADVKKMPDYEKSNTNKYENYTRENLHTIGVDLPYDSFYFPEAGICDASEVCTFLLQDIDMRIHEAKVLNYSDAQWQVDTYVAKELVLTTGFENTLFEMQYMGIHGIWGNRGDFSSSLALPVSMHQSMSVAANIEGVITLGATHERGVQERQACEEAQAYLLKNMASSLIDTSDFKLKEIYCGMRAGSRDAFPLIGKIIDVAYMLDRYPSIRKGSKAPLQYIKHLYVYNGLGGRGFVFAPWMAEMLAAHIVSQKEIDTRVNPDRLFWKWVRKEGVT